MGIVRLNKFFRPVDMSRGQMHIDIQTAASDWLRPTLRTFPVLFILSLIWRYRSRRIASLHVQLQDVIRQRKELLWRDGIRDANRNEILEMLVSNQPLETVLRVLARHTGEHAPGAFCVILAVQDRELHRRAQVCCGAMEGTPPAWINVLESPGALPLEVWQENRYSVSLPNDPAWREFTRRFDESEALPLAIHSFPIGDDAGSLGVLLLLYGELPAPIASSTALKSAARLAQVAVEHRRYCDELNFQAYHDSLTGLPNRTLFNEKFEIALAQADERAQRVAFLYLDLDGFKQINDRMSHRAGDVVLKEIATRASEALRSQDMLARTGGDEFNVFLPDIESAEAAAELTAGLLSELRKPIEIDGQTLVVTASAGIAIFPDDGTDALTLQRQADAAMYCAKNLGKNRLQAFQDRIDPLDDLRIEMHLRQALAEDWFSLHYQPKFTSDGNLAGLEALLRFHPPDLGPIPPSRFIPVAESAGLIGAIGQWVLSEVCRQVAAWRARGLRGVVVSVNVSALQICRPGFARFVEECLAECAVPGCCLELELIETPAIQKDSEGYRQLQALRALGVAISIDAFGTGYGSLSYLGKLEVDSIKIDPSFVRDIATDPNTQNLVAAIIGVAKSIGIDVIAEGVETEEQRSVLAGLGCPVMQGFVFCRALPPSQIEALLNPAGCRPEVREPNDSRDLECLSAALAQPANNQQDERDAIIQK